MEAGVFAIVPDLVSPEKSSAARFGTIYAVRAVRVTEQAPAILPFMPFGQEESLPVRSHNLAGSARSVSVRVHNYFVSGVLEGVVPCGGTRSEVVVRRAGARGVIRAERTLSTGRPVQAAEMIASCSAVPGPRFAPEEGVRLGRYATVMTACTALPALSMCSLAAFRFPVVVGAR